MPCLPIDPEIPLLRIYLKEINMDRFVSRLSYSDVRCSKILIRKTLSVDTVRGAGGALELLWNGWAGPVSILQDHTEYLMPSLWMAMMHLMVCYLGTFFPFWWKFFSFVSFKLLWIWDQLSHLHFCYWIPA